MLVVDRWERVIFADGLFRAMPGWGSEDPFGRPLNSLPGAPILSSVAVDPSGALDWVDHVLPPSENHGIRVALAVEGTGRPSIKKPFDLAEMARTVEG